MYPLLNELRSRLGLRKETGARSRVPNEGEVGTSWEMVAKEEMSSEMEERSLASRITKP